MEMFGTSTITALPQSLKFIMRHTVLEGSLGSHVVSLVEVPHTAVMVIPIFTEYNFLLLHVNPFTMHSILSINHFIVIPFKLGK